MADNWVSPTGHVDADSQWLDETSAYDGNTGTSALGSANYYLELTLSSIACDKVRCYLGGSSNITIDVYYSADWHNIWSGLKGIGAWHEFEIGSTQSVTKARIKATASLPLSEFEFNDATPTTYTSTLSVDAILKGPEKVTIDALLQDTDDASLSIDAILVDQSYSAPYYIEVRDPDGVLLGTIKDIITGSLEQETNMPDVLSLAIPLNEIRASLITRKNELWVRDSVTDTVLSICKAQIAEESDG